MKQFNIGIRNTVYYCSIEMYSVAGANLFGQWFSWSKDASIFEKFEKISIDNEFKIDLSKAKLVTSCWSYNIFQKDDTFYICGTWLGKDNQLVEVPFPENLNIKHFNILIAGNDYVLVIVEKTTRCVWFYDFETREYKKVNFTEDAVGDSAVKKSRATDDIIKVVVTNNAFIYLSSEGNVYTGQLPSYVDTRHCVGKVVDVVCGYEHYMLLTDKGTVYTWGNGRRLQLGHGDLTNMDEPTEVEALSGIKIVQIKAGGWHSLALSEYSDLYAWGWNDTGQLGMNGNRNIPESNEQKNYTIPTLVDIYDENCKEVKLLIKDIAAGTRHSALLLENNTVWTTGCNKYGQLGFPTKELEKIDYFKEAFFSLSIFRLYSGPWNTIIDNGDGFSWADLIIK